MNNLSAHNSTVPTTVGALLTEECTLDPLSHLPSFLELTFVDVARNSSRRALSGAWGVGMAWLEGTVERLRGMERLADAMVARSINNGNDERSSSGLRRLLRGIRTLITRFMRWRVRLLRRLCRMFLKTVKTLGPEMQALIMFAIDYNCMHYLAGGTGCEMVYGLKRSKIVKAKMPSSKLQPSPEAASLAELTKFEKTSSAMLAALNPYWKERLDQYYNEWKERPNSSTAYHAHNNTLSSSKEKFLRLYPYLHLVHEGSIFLYQFAYLMGYSPYWSFSMHSLGVFLRRMTVADVKRQQQQKQRQQLQNQPKATDNMKAAPLQSQTNVMSPVRNNGPLMQRKFTIPQLLRGAVLFSVSYTLLSGWYSHFQRQLRLRRRRWIAGEDNVSPSQTREGEADEQRSRKRCQLPIPPPPMPPHLLCENDEGMDNWSCPICKEPRINPTASSSGYVFCYKCLISHLRQKGRYCPLTGMPCEETNVVRLYEPTASRHDVIGRIDR